MAFVAGCGAHPKPVQAAVPSPPPPLASAPVQPSAATPPATPAISAPQPEASAPPAKILFTQTGWASWYGPHYDKRQGSNGEIYDMNALTAAHLTLPLNSIARVTNLKTGDTAVVRITDRGPFVGDRIIDLSRAAAEKLNVYRPGTALVRVDLLQSPVPLDSVGRWCVQIGAFKEKNEASKLKEKLERRYRTARVLQFTSPVGTDWIRVRVADDDKKRAEEVVRETSTDAGVYLVRLD